MGQSFGTRYHIIRTLGVGGMGAVYQAWDAELSLAVAVKVIRPEIAADPVAAREIQRRFKRELLLARQVTHKNVVRIHDLGEIEGIKYITMAYVEGSDLATLLKKETKLTTSRALRIARGVVSGLIAAHHAGVVHRDLKPANIMIAADDEPTIMDFGIARSADGPSVGPVSKKGGATADLGGAHMHPHTMAGAIVGTVEYMAPEQAKGEPADQRADIYALGLILYDMLIGGRRSERATSAIAELQGRMEKAPPAPRSVDIEIPPAIDAIITRCLDPDPDKRFQTTLDLQAAFDRLDEDGKPIPIIRRVSLRTMIAAVALMFIALIGTWQYARRFVVPQEHGPVSVLITNFNNSTGDPVFDGSLEHAFTVDVEGASFIGTFDRFEARRIAERLKRGSTLDQEGGRLVAAQQGVNVILAGSIAPQDSGYAISVRAIDPRDGKQLWTESARAKDKSEVLSALGSVAAEVRKQLGDNGSKSERMAAATITANRSLDALREYAVAQDLFLIGKVEEAVPYYRRAVEADPNFGRGYANWGLAAFSLGRKDEAEVLWKKALSLADRMTEQEKYNTLATYYATIARNYEKAIESYEMLTKLSPANARAHNNLSIAYFNVRNFAKAMEEAKKAVDLYPRNVNRRVNYALYAMYASNFDLASTQADEIAKEAPGIFQTYVPLAMAAIAKNDFGAAEAAYERMAKANAQGASLAATGKADLAIYRGHYSEAQAILTATIAEDRAAKRTAGLAAKLIAQAEAEEAMGNVTVAVKAVREALQLGRDESVLVPSALLLVRAGLSAEADDIAAELDNQLQTQTRAYAKVIDGRIALGKKRRASAIDAFREAIKLTDVWMARFEMGVTYVEAAHYAEAIDELEACMKRRGEAMAMFLDESPTVRYLATLPYWLARAQEGLGQQAAATANYKAFLSQRSDATTDPLVIDARKRVGS